MKRNFQRNVYILCTMLIIAIIASFSFTHVHAAPSTPSIMATPDGFSNGETIDIHVTGFQASEQVTISWDANGGQTITTIGVDDTGTGDSKVTPPFATRGFHKMLAVGNSSGLQARTRVDVGPGIALTPTNILPGQTITVNGGAFTPNEQVQVSSFRGGSTSSTVADSAGFFTVTLKLGDWHNQYGYTWVYADGAVGHEHATSYFKFASVPLKIWTNVTSVAFGAPVTIYGQGFDINSSVEILWNAGYKYPMTLIGSLAGFATTDSTGAFSVVINAPSAIYSSVSIAASIGYLTAFTSLYESSGIVVTSSPPDNFTVSAGNFHPGSMATISIGGMNVWSPKVDKYGGVTVTVKVPHTIPAGTTTVQVSDSGTVLSTPFSVPPSVSLKVETGAFGTVLFIVGCHDTPSSSVSLNWYNPSAGTSFSLGDVVTSATGEFQSHVTVPSGISAGSYQIITVDNTTGGVAKTTFTIS